MRRLALLLLLAACLGCQAPSADAEERAPSADAPFVPRFAPPLGRPLRYRIVKERVTPARTERSIFEQQVVFERAGDGFAMRIKWLRLVIGDRSYDLSKGLDALPAPTRPVFLPVTMDLGAHGRPLRVRDWPRMQQMLLALAPVMARTMESDPAKRAAAERFARNFMQRYAALSAEEAVNHMVQAWPPVLAELGQNVELGHEVRSVMQAPTPFVAQPIDFDTVATWTLAGGGSTLHLSRHSVPSPESLRAVGSGLTDAAKQFAPPGKPVDPGEIQRVFAGMKLSQQTDIDFETATGLVRKAVIEKAVTAKGESGTVTIAIEAF